MHIKYFAFILKAPKVIFVYAGEKSKTTCSFSYALLWSEQHWAVQYWGQNKKIWRKSGYITDILQEWAWMPNANPELVVMWPQPQHSYLCIMMGSNLSKARHQFGTSHSELETKKLAFSMRLRNLNLNVPYVGMYTCLNSPVGMVSGSLQLFAHRHRIPKGISWPLCFTPQYRWLPWILWDRKSVV